MVSADYEAFLASKVRVAPATGLADWTPILHASLKPFQVDLARWSLKRGRSAIFAGTGLGKSRMQVTWADNVHRATGRDVLILAPLAVAPQTVGEGAATGVPVAHVRDQKDVRPGVNITNYDRLHRFDPAAFGAIVLDESSCIKAFDSKTLKVLLESFRATPFKLACTATPAPNDWTELGNHAEFLGVCSRVEMLSEFFVHDGGDTSVWRLKGHARGAFWRWVASWAALVSHPRDLGYEEPGYDLPPLHVHEHTIKADAATAAKGGVLFVEEAAGLMERRQARKASIDARVAACVERVKAEPQESWVVWCDLNAESDALAEAIPGSVEIRGSMDSDEKERAVEAFSRGETKVLITKGSITGWGLNWQHCARTALVGVSDSFESYYQIIRRFWRFGQIREVHAWIFASEVEGSVVANLKRKERDADEMARVLSAETAAVVRAEVRGLVRESNPYEPSVPMRVPAWLTTDGV